MAESEKKDASREAQRASVRPPRGPVKPDPSAVAYRVKQEQGYCWIDVGSGQAQPQKKFVLPNEHGIDQQLHKLEPLSDEAFRRLRAQPPVEETPRSPMNRAMSPARTSYRSKEV